MRSQCYSSDLRIAQALKLCAVVMLVMALATAPQRCPVADLSLYPSLSRASSAESLVRSGYGYGPLRVNCSVSTALPVAGDHQVGDQAVYMHSQHPCLQRRERYGNHIGLVTACYNVSAVSADQPALLNVGQAYESGAVSSWLSRTAVTALHHLIHEGCT